MSQLVKALQTLDLEGELFLSGRWVILQGECSTVYVLAMPWGAPYYTWCGAPQARAVEVYWNAVEAIQAGLRRARCPSR
jgi:hypothetical protein